VEEHDDGRVSEWRSMMTAEPPGDAMRQVHQLRSTRADDSKVAEPNKMGRHGHVRCIMCHT
jgi:hypothetical protein